MSKLSYTPLRIEKGTRNVASQSAEWKHWSRFKPSFEKTQTNAITNISSNHNTKNNLFVSSGHVVEMYSARKAQLTKTFTKFKDNVTALCARQDAKMFAVGFQSGLIQVLDVKNKLNLRTFENHKKRVNALQYTNFNDLFSGGDDMTIRRFDVAAGSVVHSFAKAHSDYIKSIKCLQENYIVTAGYDGKIKFFDFRSNSGSTLEFDHGKPVQAIDHYPSGLSVVSCGGNQVSVWDVRAARQIYTAESNKKLVTCIRVLESGERFLTGSLDQHLKVYTTDTFELTYNEKYEDAILAIETTFNQQLLAVGLNNGKLLIKKSGIIEQPESDDEKEIEQLIPQFMRLHAKTTPVYNSSFFYRGIYKEPEHFDEKIDRIGQKHGFYDRCMKKFEYKKALVGAITKNQIDVFVSILLELEQRGSLNRTITSLDDEQIKLILSVLEKRISNAKFRPPMLRLCNLLWQQFGSSDTLRQDWITLLQKIDQQTQIEKQMLEQLGVLEILQDNI